MNPNEAYLRNDNPRKKDIRNRPKKLIASVENDDKIERRNKKQIKLWPGTMLKRMFLLSLLIIATGIITMGFIIFLHSSTKVVGYSSGINSAITLGVPRVAKPTPDPKACLEKKGIWPNENEGDRIIEQLKFRPPSLPRLKGEDLTDTSELKKILIWSFFNYNLEFGRREFQKNKCAVDTCWLSQLGYAGGDDEFSSADAVIFTYPNGMEKLTHKQEQIWIIRLSENPFYYRPSKNVSFNWTATYRHDSDIAIPYARWKYYNPELRQADQSIDYASLKTKKVAWFVSNCQAKNYRLEYATKLSYFINVDIFGKCGSTPKSCPRTNADECFEMLKDYKFYLSFENSNCRDYITEKFFENALSNDVIPIVMGAHPDDYKRVAPEGSYIHVDDFESPKQLADYLHLLDSNDELYNQYFRWKGTGEFVETSFLCRVCALLHDACHGPQHYEDIAEWWQPEGICTTGSWRSQTNN